MTQASLVRFAIAAIIAALPSAGANGQAKPIQIGIAKTFLVDQPKSIAGIAEDDFKDVLKKTTGLNGTITSQFAALEVAEKLDGKQLDLGIFHAHEFAWVEKKYPDLRPLLIAAHKNHDERAYLIVHQNISAKTITDLRGQKLDMAVGTREHCRLFLSKQCAPKEPAAFFAAIEKSASPTEALDNVARGKVQAAIVDTIGLEFYKELKGPVFAKNLMVFQQSEPFPPAVVVYKPGTLDEATLKQFRDGMLKAHTIEVGRDMMKNWHIDAFETIPADYTKRLADVLKRYPAPEPSR